MDCRGTYSCHYYEAEHFLSLKQGADEFIVCFDRWTRRYPLESYDDCEEPDLTVVASTPRVFRLKNTETTQGL